MCRTFQVDVRVILLLQPSEQGFNRTLDDSVLNLVLHVAAHRVRLTRTSLTCVVHVCVCERVPRACVRVDVVHSNHQAVSLTLEATTRRPPAPEPFEARVTAATRRCLLHFSGIGLHRTYRTQRWRKRRRCTPLQR